MAAVNWPVSYSEATHLLHLVRMYGLAEASAGAGDPSGPDRAHQLWMQVSRFVYGDFADPMETIPVVPIESLAPSPVESVH